MNKSWQYHISRYQIIHHFKFLKSDTPYNFAYILASQYGTEMFLYSRQSYKSHLSNRVLVAEDIIQTILGTIFLGHPVPDACYLIVGTC